MIPCSARRLSGSATNVRRYAPATSLEKCLKIELRQPPARAVLPLTIEFLPRPRLGPRGSALTPAERSHGPSSRTPNVPARGQALPCDAESPAGGRGGR